MLAGIIEACKNIAAVGTACTVIGGAYYAADGPLPAGQRYVDAGFAKIELAQSHINAEFRLAQSQTSISVDRLLQSQLMSERSAYMKDSAAIVNPQVQLRIQSIDTQLAIINRRIEEGEKRGIR